MLLRPVSFASESPTASQRFERLYRSAQTLRVTFFEQYSENHKLVRTGAGTAFFRKPGKMRWEYEKPEKNLFLVDGKFAWFFTPADHTVTKVAARQSEDWRAPFMLLAGGMRLSRVCSRLQATTVLLPEKVGDSVLECQRNGREVSRSGNPEDAPPRVFVEIAADGELVRLSVQAVGGIETEFQFRNWEINPSLPDSLFQFSPPPGVVIIDSPIDL